MSKIVAISGVPNFVTYTPSKSKVKDNQATIKWATEATKSISTSIVINPLKVKVALKQHFICYFFFFNQEHYRVLFSKDSFDIFFRGYFFRVGFTILWNIKKLTCLWHYDKPIRLVLRLSELEKFEIKAMIILIKESSEWFWKEFEK